MTSEDEGAGGQEAGRELRGVLPAGTALRGYEVRSILGQGAFGITYRARDLTLDRDVAVKEYLPTALALREGRTTVMPRSAEHAEQFAWGRERFLDEARTLARLDRTTAIVRVYDFLEANGTAYMVMALVEGETLNKRLLREQRLTPEAVDRLVFPLLDGLEEIHAAGFLHRDIKPANIMVDVRGRPTLIDFGASRAAMAEQSATLTAIFTPGYAAGEQFTATNLGPWSDIYGLAATLYHAITGHIPPSAIERILKDTYEPLSQLQPPGYSPALLAAIDAALSVRIDDRPQSIAEWRGMLRAEELLGSVRRAPRRGAGPRRLPFAAGRGGRTGITIGMPVLLGAAAALVLLLAGGGWLAFQSTRPAITVDSAAIALTAAELEQALAERRKADAAAAEKQRREAAARSKVDIEAEARRQAEAVAELEQARAARQKAEEDLAKLKADLARRQIEAGQREQTEAALRRAAEEAAQRKAEDEAAGLRRAEEEARKPGTEPASVRRPAAPAPADGQRRAEDVSRPDAVVSPAPRQPESSTVAAAPATSPDGSWQGTYSCEAASQAGGIQDKRPFTVDLQLRLANGSGSWRSPAPKEDQDMTLEIAISVDGRAVSVTRSFAGGAAGASGRSTLTGQYRGNSIDATGKEPGSQRQCSLALSRA